MGIMLITCKNKNPLHKIDFKKLISTKILNSQGSKFSIKMHENCDFNEKEGVLRS